MSLFQKAFFHGVTRIFSLPRLSIPLVLTLGLTLGAVLSVIALSSTLLYQPLKGVNNEQQLQTFEYRFKMSDSLSVSYWNMSRLAAFSEQFKDLGEWAGIAPSDQDIFINETSYTTTRFDASHNILDVLGTRLILGQGVSIESPEKYVWISEALWQTAFGGVKSVLGKQLTVNNQEYIIAGVLEDVMSIRNNSAIFNQQVWFITNLETLAGQTENVGNISNEIDFLILKSANGQATLPTQAQTDEWLVDYIKKNVDGDNVQAFLDFLTNTKKEVIGLPYRSNMLGDTENLIIALFAAVIGLLLMATLNLLNLFIAHYQSRTKEFAIQISLGASLLKVRLLVLLENLPSFILAAITGLLVTGWALKSLPVIAGDSIPMIEAVSINTVTIISSVGIILLLSIIFSSLALVDVDKYAIANNLNSSGKGLQAQSNQWLSRCLMVIQLAIASMLLTASVMLAMQSYQAVYQDLGYEVGNSYNIRFTINDDEYVNTLRNFESYSQSEIKQLLTEASELIEQKVTDGKVIIPSYGPLTGSLQVSAFRNPDNNNERVIHQMRNLSADYFDTFGFRFLAGSNLTQAQIDSDENRVVIDEAMAKTLFPQLSYQEVIGKTFRMNGNPDRPPVIINGIVNNSTSQAGSTDPLTLPAVYSHRINAATFIQFTVMMPEGKSVNTEMLAADFTRQFPKLSDIQVRSLEDIWQEQTLEQRVSLWVVLTMTGLTLLLAAIGVAGLTQMTTNHRKYELAIRMAMGAKQAKLVGHILKDALWMLIIGLGIGFIISVFGYEQIKTQLEMMPSFDWLAMSMLDVGLIAVVLLSVTTPAWRIIKADPMMALRQD